MRPALMIASATLTLLIASCGHNPAKLKPPPERPLPTWSEADFDCGPEPAVPPQETVKSVAESYQVDTIAHARTCRRMLKARGEDAKRYGLTVGSTVATEKKAKPK